MEPEAVESVHDHRHAGAARRQAAEYPGLRGMGVHDERRVGADDAAEFQKGQEVRCRADGAPQVSA